MISQISADRMAKNAAHKAVEKHLDELGLDPDELSEDQQEECHDIYAKEIDACGAAYEDYCDEIEESRREKLRIR